jgi:hypothetical protein
VLAAHRQRTQAPRATATQSARDAPSPPQTASPARGRPAAPSAKPAQPRPQVGALPLSIALPPQGQSISSTVRKGPPGLRQPGYTAAEHAQRTAPVAAAPCSRPGRHPAPPPARRLRVPTSRYGSPLAAGLQGTSTRRVSTPAPVERRPHVQNLPAQPEAAEPCTGQGAPRAPRAALGTRPHGQPDRDGALHDGLQSAAARALLPACRVDRIANQSPARCSA